MNDPVRRVAVLSVHTSPLDQPGQGDGGGLNVYLRETARRLARRGVEVDVFTRRRRLDEPDASVLAEGVTLHRLTAGPIGPLPKSELASHLCGFTMAYRRHPAAGRHDVLHANYWLSGWVGRRLAPRLGVPLVQTFHTLGTLKNATLAPGDQPEPPLRLAAEQRIAADADRILALTCGEAALLHRQYGVSGARLTVVPPGVDRAVFHPGGNDDPADGDLLPPGDGPLLLFVGRLQRHKGVDVAVRTYAAVRRRAPSVRLLVVGGASGAAAGRLDAESLRALVDDPAARAAMRVVPAQPQHRLAGLYRSARLLLAPSRSETFGLAALESQACGTPVVAAAVSGLETVVRGGGALVRGHRPAEHSRAVLDLLLDPARYADAVECGLATAAATDWERTVDRLHAVYREVVSTPRHRAAS